MALPNLKITQIGHFEDKSIKYSSITLLESFDGTTKLRMNKH